MSRVCEHPFALYLMGAETPSWRAELETVTHVGLSFYANLQRTPKTKPWNLEANFIDGHEILIDSGALSASKRPISGHESYQAKYSTWVKGNIDRITLVLEYDPPKVALEQLKAWRSDFWDTEVPIEKFVPMWHEEHGVDELEALCKRYRHVGLKRPPVTLEGRLRSLVASHGTQLHGHQLASPLDMAKLPLASATTMVWLNPTRSQCLQVWAQNRMQIYTGRDVDNAFARHARDIRAAGFDSDMMTGDERRELIRYTIWAWNQFERDLQMKRERTGGGVITAIRPGAGITPLGDGGALGGSGAGSGGPHHPAMRDKVKVFPGMGVKMQKVQAAEGEEEKMVPVPVLRESNLRVCDSCYQSGRCPEYTGGAQCAFNFPATIDTKEALLESMKTLLSMQFERIYFARAGEQADGSLADPVVSEEIERYFDIVEKMKRIQEDSAWLEIKVRGAGSQGGGLLAGIMAGIVPGGASALAEARPRINTQIADELLGDILDVDPVE